VNDHKPIADRRQWFRATPEHVAFTGTMPVIHAMSQA